MRFLLAFVAIMMLPQRVLPCEPAGAVLPAAAQLVCAPGKRATAPPVGKRALLLNADLTIPVTIDADDVSSSATPSPQRHPNINAASFLIDERIDDIVFCISSAIDRKTELEHAELVIDVDSFTRASAHVINGDARLSACVSAAFSDAAGLIPGDPVRIRRALDVRLPADGRRARIAAPPPRRTRGIPDVCVPDPQRAPHEVVVADRLLVDMRPGAVTMTPGRAILLCGRTIDLSALQVDAISYDACRSRAPALRGSMTVHLIADAAGTVRSLALMDNSLTLGPARNELATCVLNVMRLRRLPASDDGGIEVKESRLFLP